MQKDSSGEKLLSRPSSNRRNTIPYEEILFSGGLSYRICWDWAQVIPELDDYEICGMMCDREGNLYITTRSPANPLAVFNPDGTLQRFIQPDVEIGRMHGIFVCKDGCIWIADDKNHAVYKLDQTGKCLITLGTPKVPSDTGIDAEIPSRLRFYTIQRLGGPFNRPTRLVEGNDGFLYASDGYGNAAIHKFDHHGNLLLTWGGMGDAPGKFGIPHSLWADVQGRIWVADREFDRVQIFSDDGQLITVLNNLLYPYDVVTDENYAYVSEREGRISIFDLDDFKLRAQIGYFGAHLHGHSIAVDRAGNIYIGQLNKSFSLIKLERM